MRTYRKIAEIHFKHDFYTSGLVPNSDLAFHKTPDVEKTLQNYRLMLKFKAGLIELIQECEQEDGVLEPFIEIDQELKFTIVVQQKNKQFLTFSELPFLAMGKELFCFTNKRNEKNSSEGNLAEDEFVGAKDLRILLPKSAQQLVGMLDKPKLLRSSDQAIALEIESAEVFGQAINRVPEGIYQIGTTGKTEATFALIKQKYSTADIGLIEFYVDKEMGQAIHTKPFQFSICFAARKLQWQYQVFERFNSIKNIQIEDDKDEVEFIEQGEHTKNGLNSKLFVSKQAIALKEINKKNFRIVAPSNGRAGKVWVEKLPVPKLSNISSAGEGGAGMVFKEYVYL